MLALIFTSRRRGDGLLFDVALNSTQSAYTTSAKVGQLIGTAYDDTNDVDAARITAIILEKSAVIDSALRDLCHPFNAVTSTPATPGIIEEAARFLSAAQALLEIGSRDDNQIRVARTFEEMGKERVGDVISAGGHTRHEYNSNNVLTFGSPSDPWDLAENEAFLATDLLDSGDPPHIIADSLRVTNTGYTDLRFGSDFHLVPHKKYRRWVFQSQVSALHDGTVSSPAVAYRWNYWRDFGRETVNEVYS